MPPWVQKAHRFLAASFLHTALLLGAVLAAIHAWVPVRASEPVYSRHFAAASYTRTSPEHVQEIGRAFDEMGEQSSYAYEPWVLFRERSFHSPLLNVSHEGLRYTHGVPLDCGSKEPLRVWVLGGSTVFGWGVPDSQTIPSHLQGILAAAFPDRCVQVTNFGHSYYYSSLELAYFTRLLRQREHPHCAIVLDGLNDSFYLATGYDVPYFADIAYRAWEREREEELGVVGDQPWVTFNRSMPVFRLLERFGRGPRPEYQTEGRFGVEPADPLAYALETFRTNHRAFEALGRAFGIPVLHLLQPTALEPHVAGLGEKGPTVLAILRELDAGKIEGLVSITDCLRATEHPYVDETHYSDQGCHDVAVAIGRLVVERLGQDALLAEGTR